MAADRIVKAIMRKDSEYSFPAACWELTGTLLPNSIYDRFVGRRIAKASVTAAIPRSSGFTEIVQGQCAGRHFGDEASFEHPWVDRSVPELAVKMARLCGSKPSEVSGAVWCPLGTLPQARDRFFNDTSMIKCEVRQLRYAVPCYIGSIITGLRLGLGIDQSNKSNTDHPSSRITPGYRRCHIPERGRRQQPFLPCCGVPLPGLSRNQPPGSAGMPSNGGCHVR